MAGDASSVEDNRLVEGWIKLLQPASSVQKEQEQEIVCNATLTAPFVHIMYIHNT